MNSSITRFHDYVVGDLLSLLGDRLTSKKMFGGYGLYLDTIIFAVILSSDELCYKVGDHNRADFEKFGAKQWIYTGHKNKKPTAMPYYYLPEDIMADSQEAVVWAEKAIHGFKK
jgi:DNA transformation protein and related proteins